MLIVRKNHNHFPTFSNLVDEFFKADFEKYFIPKTNAPSVNVQETEGEFFLELASPGYKKEDFEISVKENVLTISSKKKEEKQEESSEEERKYTRKEFCKTSFSRSFDLPENVDAESIKAKYENGILSIQLPKEEPKPEVVQTIAVD